MGRILDLLGEIAAWDRFRTDWKDEEIEDALGIVRENLLLAELSEAADSLSFRVVEILGEYGSVAGWKRAVAGEARLSLDAIGQLARRVDRLEEVLEGFRDGAPPDRRGLDALQSHLANRGVEPAVRKDSKHSAGDDAEG
jgi:hypothetical protein